MTKFISRLKVWLLTYEYIYLVLVFVSSIIYMSNIREVMDLSLYDEASQLKDGLNIKKGIFPSAQASPIYSTWYAFLSLFFNDNIDLYYFNWHFLTIALPSAIFLLLINMRLNPIISYTVAMIFLYSRFNYPLWPKTNNFGLLLIIIIALAVIKTKFSKLRSDIDFYTFLFFIGSFLRPEFLISGFVYIFLNIKKFTMRLNLLRVFYLAISVGIFVTGSLLEELLLIPKIMKQENSINPAILLLSVAVFGELMGLFGVMFAVPFTILLKSYLKKVIFLN